MQQIRFFQKNPDIKPKNLEEICSKLKYHACREGETLFNHGEYGDKFYIILKGDVSYLVPPKKTSVRSPTKSPTKTKKSSIKKGQTSYRSNETIGSLSEVRDSSLEESSVMSGGTNKSRNFNNVRGAAVSLIKPRTEGLSIRPH
jgi:hypothetical protein